MEVVTIKVGFFFLKEQGMKRCSASHSEGKLTGQNSKDAWKEDEEQKGMLFEACEMQACL